MINGICIPATITDPARLVEIADSESLGTLVGGWLEALMIDGTTTCYLNEEGKLKGLPVNVRATAMLAHRLAPSDMIVGDVVLLGFDPETGDDLSLPNATEKITFINGEEN